MLLRSIQLDTFFKDVTSFNQHLLVHEVLKKGFWDVPSI